MGKVLRVNPDNPERKKIKYAAELLKKGGVVVFPTDTVYGIGASVSRPGSIKKIYALKKRASGKPLVCLVGRKKDAALFGCKLTAGARKLIKRHWPGPLTLVLGVNGKGGRKKQAGTIGLRMPGNRIALALLRKAGPVAATSVNISGKKPVTRVENMEGSIRRGADLVLDGGRSAIARESTVLYAAESPFRILRRGALKEKDLKL